MMLRWPTALPVRPLRSLRLALLLCLGLSGGAAVAQVAVNQILFPVNIGRTLDATVSIDYTRTSAALAVIRTPIPAQLGVDPPAPPAGCTVLAGPIVECTVPAGASGSSGSLSFPVRGSTLGSFSLVATATGGSSASNTGTVRSSGDLTVLKSQAPSATLTNGQSTTFTLQPQLAAGADNLPAGASLTLTDQLPGTVTDFRVAAINAGIASCNTVASANTTRTVSCTIAGPRTAAELNAASISITGAPGTTGTFTNVGSISTPSGLYLDRDPDNNTASVNYTVNAGGDVQALAGFPAGAVLGSSAQTLSLSWRNNGPVDLPAGGTVSTTIPAGFTVVSLPAGCSGPATGVVLAAPAALSCTAAAGVVGSTQGFALPLLMPATPAVPGSGSFTVTAAPPAGFGDAVPANNSVTVPWAVVEPFADLRLAKSKSPSSGPVAAGSVITTTLTVSNDAASPSAATYSASGGGTPLRVIDYLRPEEIAGDVISAVTPGWACTVSTNADPSNSARSRRVECIHAAAGSLAPGASLALSFSTTVAVVSGQVTLANRACTGETMLSLLGLQPTDGPQPPGNGQTGNDCVSAGGSLIATDVISGQAAVAVRKESSIDGTTWFDAVADAPTLPGAASAQFWRITVSTPAGGSQAPIPTLNLSDTLPGILNVASPGAPVPAYVTPTITVDTTVTAGAASGTCPNVAAGTSSLACSFTNVAPGTTVVVSYSVQRPFASGTLSNTATLTSPDALLSGTVSDGAAIVAEARIDVAATTKTVTPGTPRIGQAVQFTITTQNYGPDTVAAAGDFKITDDLNTSTAGGSVAFGDISASGTAMACTVATSALPDEAALAVGHVRVRCLNTTPVARYATRTITIGARVLKPAGLPATGNVYTAQGNTARVDIPDSRCEFKTESSVGTLSSNCNDSGSTSNNARSVSFDVLVPEIDVQQRKTRVLPAGQAGFVVGQPLRYRFRLQNNGPSRAEGVSMSDQLSVPAGFTLSAPRVLSVNAAAAESGYTLDTGKTASVSCSQAAPNANVVCTLGATAAASFLDAGREVNFEIELTQDGSASAPVTFGNEALVCADEATAGFESSGACNRAAVNNNNLAAVNDVIFPRTDLSLSKTTVTPMPVGLNEPVEFRLVAQNRGPSALQQMRITDVLPAGFELMTTGAQAPSLTLGSAVTQAPSSATGAALACTAVPATLTLAGQQQTVTCVVDATPGPLGAGAFPGNTGGSNTVTLRLFARAVPGLFTGPWRTNRNNDASIAPGLDGGGSPLSLDTEPGNNSASSVLRVDRSSLQGRVFFDRNGSGAQDNTTLEPGLGGVTVTLVGTDTWGNTIARTVTTSDVTGDGRGDFRFDDLPPGSYTVTETQPADYLNSPGQPARPDPGGTYAAAATVATSRWSAISLPLGFAASGYLFPEILPGTTVSGKVFSDRNGNGALDVADASLANVSLGLYLPGTVCPASGALPANPLQTVNTDSTGRYTFTGVPIGGNFVICQQQPEGHADRSPLPGTAGSTPRANQIDITALPADGSIDNDFPESLGFISGLVFFDHDPASPGTDNNGSRDAAEPAIGSATPGAGVPITLTGTPSAGAGAGTPIAPRTVTTAADGSWRFDDLLPGAYTVTQGAIPLALGLYVDGINSAGPVTSGTAGAAGAVGDNAIRDIVLGSAGASSSNNRFAELPRTTIWGVVFADHDRDRQLTAADRERLRNVTIELRQGGTGCNDATLLGSTVTAADGSWVFPGGTVSAGQVLPGQTYRVCERQPADYLDGPTLPGVNGTSPTPNQIVVTNLPLAGSGNNWFAEWTRQTDTPSTISGTVFIDRDRDGLFTTADPGRIDSVVLRLVAGSSCSGTEIGRTSTDTMGRYRFPGGTVGAGQVTAGGTYSVCEEQPTTYGDGPTRPGTAGTRPADNHILIASLPASGSSGNDFGELGARIAGRVYLDLNHNGRIDSGEAGIGNVNITVVGAQGQRNLLTDADGRFAFDDLPAGTWNLVEQDEQPRVPVTGGTVPTIDGLTTPGSGGGTATAPGAQPSRISGITLPAGEQAIDNLFGERLPVTPPGPGSQPSLVVTKGALQVPFMVGQTGRYRITVRNAGSAPTVGAYTVSDRLPAGLTLAATPSGTGWVCSGAAGDSRFSCSSSALIAANSAQAAEIELVVQVADAAAGASPVDNAVLVDGGGEPAGDAPTPDERDRFDNRPDSLPACSTPAAHNACRSPTAVIRPASLAGRVWLDDNRDGRIDASEVGIAGVTVVLTGTDDLGRSVSLTQTTGPDGRYDFSALRPGTYTVTEPTQPAGTGNGLTVPGSTGGTATGLGQTPSAIGGIVLPAGQRSVDNNFGETTAGPSLVVGKTTREARFLVGRPGHYRIEVRNTGSGPTRAAVTVQRPPARGRDAGRAAGRQRLDLQRCRQRQRFSCSQRRRAGRRRQRPVIELTVNVADSAAGASPVHNAVLVEGGGESTDRAPGADERDRFDNRPDTLPICTQPPTHNACRASTEVQRTAALSGSVWLDGGPDRASSTAATAGCRAGRSNWSTRPPAA
jgi:uncharacterized repeat protein (TIGR01451 family)